MVRLTDIAARLGLSIATVSRALNPTTAHLISETVRLQIQSTASQLGYTANRAAQQLVHGRSYTLGVVLATAFDSLFFSDHMAKVLKGIYDVLAKEKRYSCKLVILPREKKLSAIDHYVLSSGVDGLLISTQCDFSADELYRVAEQLQGSSKRPVVALNLPLKKKSRITVVSYDNREAARRAVEHLIHLKRRRIGLVYADNNSEDARERVEGYKDALGRHRILLRQALIAQGDFSSSSGFKAAMDILKKDTACDALFCLNDEMAIGAIQAVSVLGRQCPKDVAVIGFDGLTMGALVHPALSTMAQPATEMARQAAQLLIDRIEGRRNLPRSVLVATDLILRESA